MKLHAEAWLEFKIIKKNEKHFLQQTATYCPEVTLGRLYWYSVLPFHYLMFEGRRRK
jgi:hypothetical protein